MKRRLAILLTAMALAGWAFAQDAEDKQDQKQQQAEQTKAAQKGHDKDAAKPSGEVTITKGPDVTAQDTSATIQWKTNKKGATFVRYGTDANNLNQKQWLKGGTRNHAVTLSNLEPGTLYYFAIMADDDAVRTSGQFQTSGQSTAGENTGQATQPPAASNPQTSNPQPANENAGQASTTQPPTASGAQTPATGTPQAAAVSQVLAIVKGPAIEFVTPNAVVIDWSTDVRSSSIVHYGKDKNNLDQTAEAPWGSSFHRVTIQNLDPSTTYYFAVESSQAEGTGSGNKSAIAGFQTPAPGSQAQYNPPVIH